MPDETDRAAKLRGIASRLERLPDQLERVAQPAGDARALSAYEVQAGRLIYQAVEAGAFNIEVGSSSYNSLKDEIDVCRDNGFAGDDLFLAVWIVACQNWMRQREATAIPIRTGMPDAHTCFREYCAQFADAIRSEATRIESADEEEEPEAVGFADGLDLEDGVILRALHTAGRAMHYVDLATLANRSEGTCKARTPKLEAAGYVQRNGERGGFSITPNGVKRYQAMKLPDDDVE